MFDSPELREEFVDVGVERGAAPRTGIAALSRHLMSVGKPVRERRLSLSLS
jgi:hypothetical protein